MSSSFKRAVSVFVMGYCFFAAPVVFGEVIEQKLDRVDVFTKSTAVNFQRDLDVAGKPWVRTPYSAVSGSSFKACQNTGTRGLYCLNVDSAGNHTVRRWPDPLQSTADSGDELFNCKDGTLGLDTAGICAAMTVDFGGNIWIAGRQGTVYSLIKIVAADAATGPFARVPMRLAGSCRSIFRTSTRLRPVRMRRRLSRTAG